MQIETKFGGRCVKCGGRIQRETMVEWEKAVGISHIGECPKQTTNGNHQAANGEPVGMGVYRKDGKIYVVKPNKDKTKVYAKEIVPSPPRLTEKGEEVDFETVYRAGMVYNLTADDKWPLAEAAAFLTKYARCIVCGRHLKAAKSVANSIGPVCAGYFA
jgi:hypothetical protein